ncbi:hypothetical protein D3C85_1489730 [compost metagenome]
MKLISRDNLFVENEQMKEQTYNHCAQSDQYHCFPITLNQLVDHKACNDIPNTLVNESDTSHRSSVALVILQIIGINNKIGILDHVVG